MRKLLAMGLAFCFISIAMFVCTACDKFQGKTFTPASIDVCYMTNVNEEGIVSETMTMPIDDYLKDIMLIADHSARSEMLEQMKADYGIKDSYFKFSRTNGVKEYLEESDEVTGKKVAQVIPYTYELSGDAIQIKRSVLDENGAGVEYTERLEIITRSQIQNRFFNGIDKSSRFTSEDIEAHRVYYLIVNNMCN